MSVRSESILGWSIVLGYGISSLLFTLVLELNAGVIVSGLGILFVGAVITLVVAGGFYLIAQVFDRRKGAATDLSVTKPTPVETSLSDPFIIEAALETLNKLEIDLLWRKLYGYSNINIARDLKIRSESVKLLEENIKRKLNVQSFDELFNIFLILGYFSQAPGAIEKQRPDLPSNHAAEAHPGASIIHRLRKASY